MPLDINSITLGQDRPGSASLPRLTGELEGGDGWGAQDYVTKEFEDLENSDIQEFVSLGNSGLRDYGSSRTQAVHKSGILEF